MWRNSKIQLEGVESIPPWLLGLSDQAILNNALAVSVTESWLKPDVKDNELLVNFPGFVLYRSDRKTGRVGESVLLSGMI